MRTDRESPIELHAQITNELRYRIAAGVLAPGTRLPSTREGAKKWGVNFHTVRRAYRELARIGLVEINGPAGTRVADATIRFAASEGLGAFIDELLARSSEDYGLALDELIVLLRNHGSTDADSTVTVVECNAEQTRELADQVSTAFDVDAAPYVLSQEGPPPRGIVLGSLFHRAEMLERWPDLRPAMRFLPIHPDSSLVQQVRRSADERVPLFARNAGAARAMASDVESIFGVDRIKVEPQLLTSSGRIPRAALSQIVFVGPVDWATLPSSQRDHPHVVRVPYRFDHFRLGAVAHRLGWGTKSASDQTLKVCPYNSEACA